MQAKATLLFCAGCTRSPASFPSAHFSSSISSPTRKRPRAPQAYNDQVKFLTSLPFVHWMEWLFIFLPLLYHALYGIYIWYKGDSNVGDYPWSGNWLYTSQRWTGIIAFIYIAYHLYTMRFTGVHLMGHSNAGFWKVQQEFHEPLGGGRSTSSALSPRRGTSRMGSGCSPPSGDLPLATRRAASLAMVCAGLAVILVAIGICYDSRISEYASGAGAIGARIALRYQPSALVRAASAAAIF